MTGASRPDLFLQAVSARTEGVHDSYPFDLPALRHFRTIEFTTAATFLVGENASGKSTLLEAIAIGLGINVEGGTTNVQFATRRSESELHSALRLVRSPRRPRTLFFLRAESFFNLATYVETLGIGGAYGDRALHEQSHGESFISVMLNRFVPEGLYLLDEPEAALSVRGQLAALRRMHDLVSAGSQFIVATHSPLLLAFPDASILELSDEGIRSIEYEDTDNYALTRSFLESPERFFRHLFSDDA